MGLDTVELVMEIEEEFDIAIADEEAPGIITVGDLYRYVLAKLGIEEVEHRCGSAAAFYRLRHGLVHGLGLRRDAVRPSSRTDDLIPRCERKYLWGCLAETMALNLPPLRRPRWMVEAIGMGLVFTFISTFLALAIVSPAIGGSTLLVWPAIFAAIVTFALGDLARLATEPLAVEYPDQCDSVGGFARAVLAHNYTTITGPHREDEGVWRRIVEVVAEQCGVSNDTITKDTSFVDDLGMD